MKKSVVIIFPHHLFKNHPALSYEREILLIEASRYFLDFKFHKQKLMLHRASMKAYQAYLEDKSYTVHYVTYSEDWQKKIKGKEVHTIDPFDYKLKKQLPKGTIYYPSPGFLGGELKKSKRYLMGNFYKRQRKALTILMDGNEPLGGQWSFDQDNRKPLPEEHVPPAIPTYHSAHVDEAHAYVMKHFPKNPGSLDEFIYPVTHHDAQKWLKDFIKERLPLFGDYQDALSNHYRYLYHSLLSPLLNIGLLTPDEVVMAALRSKAPLNSVEGFIRQIIGWREFILQIYLLEGETQRASNFFNHHKKLPQSFYTGKTGIVPVDRVIQRVITSAYAHHIERLMILGNYMLLNEYDPTAVYRWFMEMFIDSYDWVMVPNIYGMSQYADGGLMATKPYISASNYIRKMSDFPHGDWCNKWDNLFWNFLRKHKKKLAKNPRMALLLKNKKLSE